MIRAVRAPSAARQERGRREFTELAERWGVEPAVERLVGTEIRA
jgi:hypothetical protein